MQVREKDRSAHRAGGAFTALVAACLALVALLARRGAHGPARSGIAVMTVGDPGAPVATAVQWEPTALAYDNNAPVAEQAPWEPSAPMWSAWADGPEDADEATEEPAGEPVSVPSQRMRRYLGSSAAVLAIAAALVAGAVSSFATADDTVDPLAAAATETTDTTATTGEETTTPAEDEDPAAGETPAEEPPAEQPPVAEEPAVEPPVADAPAAPADPAPAAEQPAAPAAPAADPASGGTAERPVSDPNVPEDAPAPGGTPPAPVGDGAPGHAAPPELPALEVIQSDAATAGVSRVRQGETAAAAGQSGDARVSSGNGNGAAAAGAAGAAAVATTRVAPPATGSYTTEPLLPTPEQIRFYVRQARAQELPKLRTISHKTAVTLVTSGRQSKVGWTVLAAVAQVESGLGRRPGAFAGRRLGSLGHAPASVRNDKAALAALAAYLRARGATAFAKRPGDATVALQAYFGSRERAEQTVALAAFYGAIGIGGMQHGLAWTATNLRDTVLKDKRVKIYAAGRKDIKQGRVDARVLIVAEYLANAMGSARLERAGLGPPPVQHLRQRLGAHLRPRRRRRRASAAPPIAGHQGAGTVTEKAVRLLLMLPGEVSPRQIISLHGSGRADRQHRLVRPDRPLRPHPRGVLRSASRSSEGRAAGGVAGRRRLPQCFRGNRASSESPRCGSASRHARWRWPRRSRSRGRPRTRKRSSASRSRTEGTSATARPRRTTATARRRPPPARSSTASSRCSATTRSRSRRSRRGCGAIRARWRPRPRVDAALHDLVGKLCGQPTWRLLGLAGRTPHDHLHARHRHGRGHRGPGAARGRRRLSHAQDQGRRRGRPRAPRRRPPHHLAAACAWTPTRAGRSRPPPSCCRRCVEHGVELDRAAVPGRRHSTRFRAPARRSSSGIPIVIDEGCHTLAGRRRDRRLRRRGQPQARQDRRHPRGAAHDHAARALGLRVMLGCMVESSAGIAPPAQIASLCDFVDLDGHLLIADDPFEGLGLRGRRASCCPSGPGLGVTPRLSERIAVFADGWLETTNGKAAHGLIRYARARGRGRRRLRARRQHGRSRSCRTRATPVPIVATVEEAVALGATACHRRRADRRQAAAGVEGAVLREALAAGLRRRGGPARRARRRPRARRRGGACTAPSCATCAPCPPGSRRRPARRLRACPAHASCTPVGTRLRDRQDDRRARARPPRRASRGERAVFVPTGQIGHLDRRLGHRRRPRDLRLRRRRGRAARRCRAPSAATCCSSRARARSCTRPTPASRSACCTAARRTRSCSCTRPGSRPRSTAGRRWRSRRCASSATSTSAWPSRCARRPWSRSRSTRGRIADDGEASRAVERLAAETGLPCADPVRGGAPALWAAVEAALA